MFGGNKDGVIKGWGNIIRNFIICTHHLGVHQFKEDEDKTWELSYMGKTSRHTVFLSRNRGGGEKNTLAA
jgi:hypothetical protein